MNGGIFQVFRRGRFKLNSPTFNIMRLFYGGEQGAWYDPSDMSTLFQDSAGTTPVTAVEQPVGRMLDKSGRGNHALQATTTKRPVLSRRVNLLDATLPTGLRNGTGALIPNAFGGVSGYQLTRTGGGDEVYVPIQPTALFPGASYTLDVYLAVGASDRTAGVFSLYTSAGYTSFSIDYSTGVFSAGQSTNGFSCSFVSSESVAGGWRTRIKFTIPTSASAITLARMYMWTGAGLGSPGQIVGNPQFTLATDAHLPYQWVNTDTDYDADPAKFPAYLRFDGVDDALQTGNIDFTSTDKMTVWAGVTKLAPSGFGMLYELGNVDATNGSVGLVDPYGPAGTGYVARGTVVAVRSVPISAPATYIATSVVNLSGATRASSIAARRDGVSYPSASGDGDTLGGGAFGNHVFSIGARGGINTYFNGRLYSLIVRGTQTPLSQIEATELYIKQKMRMP